MCFHDAYSLSALGMMMVERGRHALHRSPCDPGRGAAAGAVGAARTAPGGSQEGAGGDLSTRPTTRCRGASILSRRARPPCAGSLYNMQKTPLRGVLNAVHAPKIVRIHPQ